MRYFPFLPFLSLLLQFLYLMPANCPAPPLPSPNTAKGLGERRDPPVPSGLRGTRPQTIYRLHFSALGQNRVHTANKLDTIIAPLK